MRASSGLSATVGAPFTHSATLRDYLNILRRRKWLIIGATVVVPVVAFVLAKQQAPTYEASAEVLLAHQSITSAVAGVPDVSGSSTQSTSELTQTQADVARVPQIAEAAVNSLHPRVRTAGQLLAESSVSPIQGTDVITFTVNDSNPTYALELARAYAFQYTRYRRTLDTKALLAARTDIERAIAGLVSRGKSNGNLYDSLSERANELQTQAALATSNASLLLTNGSSQVGPRPTRDATLGLVLGLTLGILLAFGREALDTRVRSSDEIIDRLGLPLIARLPAPPRRFRQGDRLVMLDDPSSIAAEPLRILHTNLEFALLDRDARILMVSSAVEQEGKSTTAANLAVAAARGGKSVVLVDLDLRRPFLDRFFDLQGRPGLTQVALGHAELSDVIVKVDLHGTHHPELNGHSSNGSGNGFAGNGQGVHGSLSVLPSGPLPPDPGEFVRSASLTRVLDELRILADVIIIDSPPILRVGDAMTLSTHVDALVLVARLDKVRRHALTEVRRQIDVMPAFKAGFVITGAEMEDAEYGYGYGYRNYGYSRLPDAPKTTA